jgi:hypothetical protein
MPYCQLVKVTINPLSDILDLTNSPICEGETATLSSTAFEQGVSYQLFDGNGVSWGVPLEGTGSELKWVDVPVGTGYYVVGTNQTTHCMSKSSNLADVIVDFTEVDASESSNPVPVNSTAMLKATVFPATYGVSVLFQMNGEDLGESVTDDNGLATFEVYLDIVGVHRIDAETYCSSSTAYLPVYDPTAGFVTGGGWINSPEGAYAADQSLTGKANFGFVSKYKKGQSIPDGNTEFQFQAGNLNFKSTMYDWLIIAGTKAMFKGEGIINDNGRYGFQLSAIDDESDKFRIKIWDKDAEDAVVYDNNIGSDENADPSTELGGGSIVIHSVKKKSAEILSNKTESNVNVYPNPFQDKAFFHFISPEDVSAKIDVYDITGRKVKTLFNDFIRKDVTYTTVFEPNAPISGIYIYRMTLGESVFTGKLVVSGR